VVSGWVVVISHPARVSCCLSTVYRLRGSVTHHRPLTTATTKFLLTIAATFRNLLALQVVCVENRTMDARRAAQNLHAIPTPWSGPRQ